MSSFPLSIYLIGLARAVLAVLLLTGFSLIGFSSIPRSLRPAKARLSVPLSLSFGSALFGWLGWVAGTLIGTPAIFVLFAILLLLSLRSAGSWWRACRIATAEIYSLLRHQKLLSAVLALPVLAMLPQLLLPVVDSDGLRYHLALPKLFLLSGHVSYYRWDVTGAFPQTSEMIYLLAIRIAGGETAKFIHALFFTGNLLVLMLLLHRRRITRTAALLAPLFFAISPVVLGPASSAFIDHIALFHVAVAVLLILRGRNAAMAGLPLGAALATKITTGPAVLAAFVVAVTMTREKRLRLAIVLSACIVFFFAPFAIRNVVETGDPVYPIGYGLLGKTIPGLRAGGLSYASRYHAGIGGVVGIPWQSTEGVQADEVVGLHHLLGLFTLLLAVRNRRLFLPLLIVLAYLGVAMVYRPPARYLLPMLWSLSIFEATAIVLLRRLSVPLAILLVSPAALGAVLVLWTFGPPFPYLRGEEKAGQLLARVVPGYRAAAVVNALPEKGRVMAMDFPAPYYFDRPWIVEGILHDPPLKVWIDSGLTAPQIAGRLKALNVRYVVVTPGYGGGTRWSLLPLAGNPKSLPAIAALRRDFKLVARVDGVDVYRVP